MKHILLVEDDERLAKLVKSFLEQHSFKVTVIDRGDTAIDAVFSHQPDLVILDIMLPEVDGFTICRQIRTEFTNPILFLTAKDSDLDHVMGLEMGADDYMIKPVDPHVLLARINSVMRRSKPVQSSPSNIMQFGRLQINKVSRQVEHEGHLVDLTSHEFELLLLLAQHAGEVLSRDNVHQAMIGREYDGLDRTVDVRVSRLRKKLGDDTNNPCKIITVWGKGYVFSPEAWS